MSLAPIALFVYNRPVHTCQTVEALLKNELAGESDLVIFSDAPKNPNALDSVNEVRTYIKSISGFKSVSIIERDKNWGLANSIIDGVTSIVNKYGRIIVLEDDLIVTTSFLDYMNRALDKYEVEQKVIQVSGYMFPVDIKIEEDALFLPLTTSWGWGTWKRAWQLFDPDAKGYEQIKGDIKLRKSFNLDDSYDYFSMLEAQLAGRVDSWAIRWYLSTFIFYGITIYPSQSLIVNSGFDGSGSHGLTSDSLFRSDFNSGFSPMVFPNVIALSNQWANVRTQIGSLQPTISGFRKITSSITRMLSRVVELKARQ